MWTAWEPLWGMPSWRPTKIYVKALRAVKEAGVTVKGCSPHHRRRLL